MSADTPIHIYVETTGSLGPAYAMPEGRVRAALGEAAGPFTLTARSSDDPDVAALGRAEVFLGSRFDTARLREHGGALRIVHCTSAGIERYLPLDWLPSGAVLTNSRGIHAEKGGEYGLLALLMLNDRLPRYITNQRRHAWAPEHSTPIRGKTVLIYGVGAIGGAIAARAKALGLRVWGIRRSGGSHPHLDRVEGPDQLDALLPEVDFLVVACPLTAETRGAIGAAQLDRLRPHAGLVNVARAAIVDYDHLADALRGDRLAGAVLDVFAPEPLPPDSPLWDVPNLVVTPHTSSDDPDGYIERSLAIVAANLGHLRTGAPLVNVVDPVRGY